jgi:Flp pilus assembly protein TadG
MKTRLHLRAEQSGERKWMSRARAFGSGTAGASFVEFGIIAIPLFMLFFGIIEVGLMFWASFELENATADAARLLRTGQALTLNAADFKTKICGEVFILSNCSGKVQVNIQTFPGGFSRMAPAAPLDANRNLVTSFNGDPTQVAGGQDVLLTTYYAWPVIDPLTRAVFSNMAGGAFLLQQAAAFRTEPF